MIDKESIDKELEEKCLKKRTITISPTVTIIEQKEEAQSLFNRHKNSSEYFLEGTKTLLKSSTPLLAILIGYFAIEHKANQLLALRGYKVESHICTQLALSRIIRRKDLAKQISAVFESRQNIGYRMFLKHSEEERKNAERIINEEVLPFIKEINDLIEIEYS